MRISLGSPGLLIANTQIRLPNGFCRRSARQRDDHRYVSPFGVWLHRDLTPFAAAELARRYQTEGINAYVNLIQNKERELGIDIITHQKWFVPSNLVRSPPLLPSFSHVG